MSTPRNARQAPWLLIALTTRVAFFMLIEPKLLSYSVVKLHSNVSRNSALVFFNGFTTTLRVETGMNCCLFCQITGNSFT